LYPAGGIAITGETPKPAPPRSMKRLVTKSGKKTGRRLEPSLLLQKFILIFSRLKGFRPFGKRAFVAFLVYPDGPIRPCTGMTNGWMNLTEG
jgi:hypothetical protein